MKELLVVIDYQNDFVNGALGFEGAEKLDGPIVEKIREYRRRGADVIFTRDTHRENYLETQEGRRLPVVHCIEGSHGHNIFGETAKQVQQLLKAEQMQQQGQREIVKGHSRGDQ